MFADLCSRCYHSDSQSRAILSPRRHLAVSGDTLFASTWGRYCHLRGWRPQMLLNIPQRTHKHPPHQRMNYSAQMSVVLRLRNTAIPSPLSNEICIIPLHNFMKCMILILWDWLNIWHFSILYQWVEHWLEFSKCFSLQAICFILLHFGNIIYKIDHLKMCVKIDD